MIKNISPEIEEAYERGRQDGLREANADRIRPPMCCAPRNMERIPATYFARGDAITNMNDPDLYCTLPLGHPGPHRCETRSPVGGGMMLTNQHMWGEQTLLCQKCGDRLFDEHPNEPVLLHAHRHNWETNKREECGGEFKRISEAEARKLRLEGVARDREEREKKRGDRVTG